VRKKRKKRNILSECHEMSSGRRRGKGAAAIVHTIREAIHT
jgi:hypothetical protein